MRTIQNVQAIGIYPEEIRIVSKDEEPATFSRDIMKLSVIDAEKITDEVQARERRVVIQLKDAVHCDIYNKEIVCGAFIGQQYYVKGQKKARVSKSFTVNSKDLFDREKNPNLSLSAHDIEKNKKIPKKYL